MTQTRSILTQLFERKLGQENAHKFRHPRMESAAAPRGAVLESSNRSLEPYQTDCRLVSVARRLVGIVTRGFVVLSLSLCLQVRGAERAKSRGAHWGKLPVSTIERPGRRRLVSGNHLACTCLLHHADLCCWWPGPSVRKHEAAEDEGRRTSQCPCRITCWRGAGVADGGL